MSFITGLEFKAWAKLEGLMQGAALASRGLWS
jgi:hypothetical protein